AERTHVAHTRKAHLQAFQPRAHEAPDLLRALQQLLFAHHLEYREPRGTAERGAGEGPAQPARTRRVHDVGLAGDGRQRYAAGHALREGDEVRLDPGVLDGEHASGAAEAALDLVGDQHDTVAVAHRAQPPQKLGRRRIEP